MISTGISGIFPVWTCLDLSGPPNCYQPHPATTSPGSGVYDNLMDFKTVSLVLQVHVNILITKLLIRYASLWLISICKEIKMIICECCHQENNGGLSVTFLPKHLPKIKQPQPFLSIAPPRLYWMSPFCVLTSAEGILGKQREKMFNDLKVQKMNSFVIIYWLNTYLWTIQMLISLPWN